MYKRQSSYNSISGNNIANNQYGIYCWGSSNNVIYHNNFIDNSQQVYFWEAGYANVWDDGYPSGGNYWSDYAGVDADGDGIGDTPYVIDENNTDRYPLMSLWIPPEHDLVVSITAPASLSLGDSSSLKATVTNQGSNDEATVELSLLINGSVSNSTTIPILQSGSSYTLTYLWTPTEQGTYNVTAYARPVPGEASVENNQMTKFVTVSTAPTPPEVQVGVKAGDWIKLEYTVSGWPAGQPYPEWLKIEFLSVEGTNATVRVTMHMSDGTEQNDTVPITIGGGGEALGLSGLVIPANLTVGDSVYISGYGNVTLAGETTRSYAGASRTVVYASFSQYGTQLTYYWDKQTGVMVEASTTSDSVTATAKATETNMWQAETRETIYIRADGSIEPVDAPISTFDNVTYTLTDNIASSADGIVVERDNIVIDGAGYTLQGTGIGTGVDLSQRSNVTIKNTIITTFYFGILLNSSSNNIISGNNITANNNVGVYLTNSSNNTVSGNKITNNWHGIAGFDRSSNNSIFGNNVTDNGYGIYLRYSSNNNNIYGNTVIANTQIGLYLGWCSQNALFGNDITNNHHGIFHAHSLNNAISENNIANNDDGVFLCNSSNNRFYHNNFIGNTQQVYDWSWDEPYWPPSVNVWDDGYPSGGNYWSDYTGVDADGDGIGDTAYVIDENNRDRYPLMNPWGSGTPVASFSWSPSTPEVGELVTFDASASLPVGGEIVSYEWDFGDGNHATGEIVTHAYDSAGTYTVTLIVTDSEGLWDVEQKQIEVKAPPPPLTVSISPTSASILVGQSVTFASTVSGGYTPYSYQWFLNGNPVSGATSDTWTFTPTESGIFYVYLKVTDAEGNTAQSDTARITVAAVPVGGYSIPIQAPATAKPLTPYLILTAILTIAYTTIKRKTTKKTKKQQ